MKRYINNILTKILTLTLLLILGASETWGQDYSGVYYIASDYRDPTPDEYKYDVNTLENNYYMCPSDWVTWCTYQPTDNFYPKNTNSDYPFVTTYQCRTSAYAGLGHTLNEAKWIIKKHSTDNFYYIIHAADDKYLMLNGPISTTTNANRMRVHLEAVPNENDLNDNALFSINEHTNGKSVIIRPKTMTSYQLTVNAGNANSLAGDSGKDGGPNNTEYANTTKGIIGIYNQTNDDNKYFYLEDYIKRPTIGYNSDGNVEITYATSAQIYYTIDGSDPTDETNTARKSFTGTSEIVEFTNSAVVRAAAFIDDEYSNIAIFTCIKLGSTNPYLFQNVENTWFYMIAAESATNTPVNTSSLPQAGMSWWFEDANDVTEGLKYYYVHNTLENGYLRRDGNNFYITATSGTGDDYKFAIIPIYNESGILTSFYLYNKGKKQYVYKGNSNNIVGNGSVGVVNLTTDADQDLARWNLILVANKSFPSPVTLSDNSSVTYYTFASSNTPAQLIITPTGTSTYVKTSDGENDNQKWYFKDAGTDGWASYYYIMNAVTGEAMYFGKDAASTAISDALEMGPLPETPTDNYKFALAHTIANGEYYIIPKPLAEYTKTKYTAVWYVDNKTSLQTQSDRVNTKIKWQITEIEDYVAPPLITYDLGTGLVTISCTTAGATVHYTTDGSDPTASSTSYSAAFPLGSASSIKAVAIKGSSSSNMTTKTFINGLYYIKHYKKDYRMYPSTTVDGSGNSYVTTQTLKDEEAVWDIRQQGDYYTIKHYKDNKYMWTDDATVKTNTVHLATAADTNDEKLLYEFTPVASLSGVYTIRPKNAANDDEKNFLDTTSGDNGTNTIGLYNTGDGIKWELVAIPLQPVVTVNDIDVTITNTLGDIVYTTDGTNPIESGTAITITSNSTTMTLNYGKEYPIRAISRYTDRETPPNYHYSSESTETVDVEVEQPVISVSSTNEVTISTAQPHNELITIRYNYDEIPNIPSDPTTESGTIWDSSSSITLEEGNAYIIKAIAYTAERASTVKSITISLKGAEAIHSLADITDQAGNYYFDTNFSASGSPSDGIGSSAEKAFMGKIDGKMVEISLGTSPLFEYVEDAVIKNVIISSAGVSTSGHAGAIANVATGETRIYNCGINSGSVGGSNCVGGIVGLLDGSARVINCYSYANITRGNYVGGIVGYNNVATTASNLKTMVMNCMFYGEVSGTSIAPIYNGAMITNDGDANGVNNFNFFRLESSYIKDRTIPKVYNCALGAETRFLQRFEFFRHLLNSNRELAAWWATGNAANKDEMMKWVLEPSQIGSSTPYPILKNPDYYASVVNYTPSTTTYDEANRNKGYKLTSEGDGGVLHVTISMGSGGAHFSAPSGAGFKSGVASSFDLTITDKDYEHYNFNYGKVQLPYYNDYCEGNYTGNRVVTGWKITSITGGTAGSYSTGDNVTIENGQLTDTPYNFADRKCKNKDIYSVSGRVFNQGAYWNVPEGVTAITIEPYWGKAVYLSDAYWDVTYKNGTGADQTKAGSTIDAMTTPVDVTTVGGGQRYGNGEAFNGQTVYTSIGSAIATAALYENLSEDNQVKRSVYDYAVVLVGNYHYNGDIAAGGKPYTVTSVDLDGDNEPDYSLMLRFNGRTVFHPVRYDFLNLIGLGMAQKTTGGTGSYNLGIMQPKYWFEVTNTALFRVTQFEYSPSGRVKKPIILQGGVIEQWVTQQQDAGDLVEYFHVGGNVWFKEFHRGSHQDNTGKSTPHPPISVTGGDFDEFYLTGLYQAKAATYDDNAECYINGGRFGIVAGTGMEGLGSTDGNGNITWQIDHADITEFYGGGINAKKPAIGNITTFIYNSHVDRFCGGPKFGDMTSGKKVITTATGCTFGTYFGAGYGGNSYRRYAPTNKNAIMNVSPSWNSWISSEYKQEYDTSNKDVSTEFGYQFIPQSSNINNVGRLFVEFVSFSLATTFDVTSKLTSCTINENFYGGGSLGKVEGPVTSILTDCTVKGNVFGAGYSASTPTVELMPKSGFIDEPYYYEDLGTFKNGVIPSKETSPSTTTYQWEHATTVNSTATAINTTDQILYTEVDLSKSNLGSVSGAVTLTLTGNTRVGTMLQTVNQETNETVSSLKDGTGNVYGGGDSSYVYNKTTPSNASTVVNLAGNTEVFGNVFGGGNNGEVSGSATVNIKQNVE